MTLGLLRCDPRPFEQMYRDWLPGVDWRVYDVHLGQLPADPAECDAWVGSGSRWSVYEDDPWILAYADLVRRLHAARAPFVGVCFGHQMLGHALGGRVARAAIWCVGVHQFTVRERTPWMRPPLDSFGTVMSCQDQILDPPPGAAVLAGNAKCPVGMIQVDRMLGIQGHPEYTPAYSEALMLSRAGRLGEERVRAGQASLGDPRHPAELGAWVLEFLRGDQLQCAQDP